MYNRELSDCLFPQEKAILAGQSVAAEGLLLSGVFENGIEKVRVCGAATGEIIVGFSSMTRMKIGTEVLAKKITVPSAAPYTVNLGHDNIIAGQMYIATQTIGNPTTTADQYSFTAAGVITFHSGQAGKSHEVFFKRSLTVEEARDKYREGFIGNADAFAAYDVCGVLSGKGKIFTDAFDVSVSYASGVLKTAANGLVTMGGAGTDISSKLRVISQPSLSSPWLGLEYNL